MVEHEKGHLKNLMTAKIKKEKAFSLDGELDVLGLDGLSASVPSELSGLLGKLDGVLLKVLGENLGGLLADPLGASLPNQPVNRGNRQLSHSQHLQEGFFGIF
ncbi:hypothetical protein AMR53_03980 [Thermococcus thioreducens]|uniref:Uncharacterized protein n=1 Tax=Thermococcus thioreducens TaxID=277988 RepID=A0A0Q2S5N3_9EURY|nr:hypothetical protein AMR53_03980 [Thermococcus thioreducens]